MALGPIIGRSRHLGNHDFRRYADADLKFCNSRFRIPIPPVVRRRYSRKPPWAWDDQSGAPHCGGIGRTVPPRHYPIRLGRITCIRPTTSRSTFRPGTRRHRLILALQP